MARLTDIVSFALVLVFFGGAIAAVLFIVNRLSAFTSSTKEKLRSQGYHISDKGVEVHTQKRFNREDYVDATQRGFVRALGASSFGKANGEHLDTPSNILKTSENVLKKSRSGLLRRKSDQ